MDSNEITDKMKFWEASLEKITTEALEIDPNIDIEPIWMEMATILHKVTIQKIIQKVKETDYQPNLFYIKDYVTHRR